MYLHKILKKQNSINERCKSIYSKKLYNVCHHLKFTKAFMCMYAFDL